MKQIFRLSLLLLVISTVWAAEQKTGTISVFVFKNQTPLLGSIVTVDGNRVYKSDIDGALKTKLTVGQHTVEIVGRGLDKAHLGYFKKSVMIKEGRDKGKHECYECKKQDKPFILKDRMD